MAKDLTVTLEDRPGQIASLGEALGGAEINIEGFCSVTHEGLGIIHVLVEDAAAARAALEGAGIKVEGESDALVMDVAGEDRPGTLGAMARKVDDVGVNVQVAYLATRTRGVLVTSDNAKAKAALGM